MDQGDQTMITVKSNFFLKRLWAHVAQIASQNIDQVPNTISVDTNIDDPLDRWEAQMLAETIKPSITDLGVQRQITVLNTLARGENVSLEKDDVVELMKFTNHVYLTTENLEDRQLMQFAVMTLLELLN